MKYTVPDGSQGICGNVQGNERYEMEITDIADADITNITNITNIAESRTYGYCCRITDITDMVMKVTYIVPVM